MNENISRRIQEELWVVQRTDTKVEVWLAMANGVTLMSYSEDYAREWLAREQAQGPEAA
jgi:hypothetical protein